MEVDFQFNRTYFPEYIETERGSFIWSKFSQIGGVFANGIYEKESSRLPDQSDKDLKWSSWLGVLRMAYIEYPSKSKVEAFHRILDVTTYNSATDKIMGRNSFVNVPFSDLIETMLINKQLHWMITSFNEVKLEEAKISVDPHIVSMFFTGMVNLKRAVTGRRFKLQDLR